MRYKGDAIKLWTMPRFMMKIYFLVPLILISFKSLSQTKEGIRIPTEKDEKIAEANFKCKRLNRYTASQRLKFYPFNVAKKIALISFNDTTRFENKIPVKRTRIDYTKVREMKLLSKSDLDKLTDLLYNTGFTSTDYWISIKDPGGKCYNPRNAILFLDKNGNAFEFIEICFQCYGRVLSSKKVKDGEYCEQKFDLLKSFFLQQNIKIGTAKELR